MVTPVTGSGCRHLIDGESRRENNYLDYKRSVNTHTHTDRERERERERKRQTDTTLCVCVCVILAVSKIIAGNTSFLILQNNIELI